MATRQGRPRPAPDAASSTDGAAGGQRRDAVPLARDGAALAGRARRGLAAPPRCRRSTRSAAPSRSSATTSTTRSSSLPAESQEAAAEMFNHLVTPSGTKIAHSRLGPRRVRERRARASSSRCSRRSRRSASCVRSPATDGSARYEIFHDVLANAVLAWRSAYATRRALEARAAGVAQAHAAAARRLRRGAGRARGDGRGDDLRARAAKRRADSTERRADTAERRADAGAARARARADVGCAHQPSIRSRAEPAARARGGEARAVAGRRRRAAARGRRRARAGGAAGGRKACACARVQPRRQDDRGRR